MQNAIPFESRYYLSEIIDEIWDLKFNGAKKPLKTLSHASENCLSYEGKRRMPES